MTFRKGRKGGGWGWGGGGDKGGSVPMHDAQRVTVGYYADDGSHNGSCTLLTVTHPQQTQRAFTELL